MLGPLIPRADLKPGIVRCIGKARELLDDAHLLVNANRPYGAANLFVLATQEIGKAVLLREAFESGDAWPRIAEFRSHDVKVERATTVLGSTAMWLKDGAFQHGAFQPNAFDVGVPADEPTRLEVLYVNYGLTGWLDPPPIDPSELRANVASALAKLGAIEANLLR